ncbi:MAG: TetR/AcrR family transcriptional regulator [Bacteroidetes bacterium]|nr:TetR/AcrR family transcriptional regulator [Bacteroidota bacterium]
MELDIRIKMNEKLFLRNPEESVLGKKMVKHGLILINKLGFEEFTFKKLSIEISTTEASIYRYFENKHKFLIYLINWYWSYLEYKSIFRLNNITSTEIKLKTIIKLLVEEPPIKNIESDFITENEAYKLMMWEGSKAYLTRNVSKDNKDRLFKPYKDLCERIALIIKEHNPKYKFAHSMASTLIEMAHSQKFFMQNLPALTDFSKEDGDKKIIVFLESLLFSSINSK